ncbi:MAG TPA: DedA family protein [Myxococcaceae bacterium]|nr:DedA family protein [Myxococcaceae bacterium]
MEPSAVAKSGFVTRLYLRVESYAGTPAALAALVVVSFVDSSFFPVPPFALLIPMVIAEPRRWFRLVLWGTTASVAGCVLGWAIGIAIRSGILHLFTVELTLRIDRFGLHGTVGELLAGNLWTLVLLFTFSPVFKVVTIGSGLVGVPLPSVLIAAAIGRTLRFLFFAGLARFGGARARVWLLGRYPHAQSEVPGGVSMGEGASSP